ncbi:hypothetical protein ACN2WE_00710 [Streptomyces sp. cg28]|uniref:hypothetical protein n=1 Tax=Streptomyces sp. cg28 TaxID=3403457 RepID=UPI003B21274B
MPSSQAFSVRSVADGRHHATSRELPELVRWCRRTQATARNDGHRDGSGERVALARDAPMTLGALRAELAELMVAFRAAGWSTLTLVPKSLNSMTGFALLVPPVFWGKP